MDTLAPALHKSQSLNDTLRNKSTLVQETFLISGCLRVTYDEFNQNLVDQPNSCGWSDQKSLKSQKIVSK